VLAAPLARSPSRYAAVAETLQPHEADEGPLYAEFVRARRGKGSGCTSLVGAEKKPRGLVGNYERESTTASFYTTLP